MMSSLKKYFYNSYNALDRYDAFNGNPDRYWSTNNIPNEVKHHEDNESLSSKMRANYHKLRTRKRMKLYKF